MVFLTKILCFQITADNKNMEKTISSSCYDAIIIKQENRVYKSTPFQVVFSSTLLKQIDKNKLKGGDPYRLSLFVNDRPIDIPMKMDSSGRVMFEKKYKRKFSMMTDSQQCSDDDRSQKGSSINSGVLNPKTKEQKLEEYKNEQAPTRFWQFDWLFNRKKRQQILPTLKVQESRRLEGTRLEKIKEQVYEGEENCVEPLFHISMCGGLLKKKLTKQQILKIFYQYRVEYSSFIKDPPFYLNDSNLVIKIDDSIYTWQLGIAILTCTLAYGRSLSKTDVEDIIKNKFTRSKIRDFLSMSGSNITKLDVQDQNQRNNFRELKKVERPRVVIKHKKTPDTETIKKMKLKYGKNIARFQLNVGFGVKEEIVMKIFLWDHQEKIVISDIDGTITKSDIWGQILSKWIHSNIVNLFTEISKRHYKIIYLTARAIGQYQMTSKFLSTVEEMGIKLPEGPLMMSPDGYYRSFTREVIYKTPDYLKTKILASLNELFPNCKNPIYCGFGNRQTDSAAYLKINVAPERIFCINEKSIISNESDRQFSTTYTEMLENVDEYFPEYFKLNEVVESSSSEQFQMVGLEDSSINKSKSMELMPSLDSLLGFEQSELEIIGSKSRYRKSVHGLSDQELEGLVNQQVGNDKISEEKSQNSGFQQKIQEFESRSQYPAQSITSVRKIL